MGASRIQGITVEIGGDTTKLTAALKGVNGEIRTTQSQLGDVNNLLKLDSGNTERLKSFEEQANQSAVAVKTAADFDSVMSQVGSVSGATGKDLDALRDKVREMGAKTKFSASEAAEVMNYMAMDGRKTSDILAAASSNANTNVSMMGETFEYCAPIAGDLGFSAEDTAEVIGLMGNTGIKSTQVGTALRTIMSNLSGEVKICGSSIGEETIATTNADGSMRDLSAILTDCRTAFGGLSELEKAAAAEALVGKNVMSGFLALMNAAPADFGNEAGHRIHQDKCGDKEAAHDGGRGAVLPGDHRGQGRIGVREGGGRLCRIPFHG